ncbi:hypothetical protein FAVG1_01385 [Fusarium avenaceum]|nr:hypothetical protein FAVG1_01385 [Fusarium avenaceum]
MAQEFFDDDQVRIFLTYCMTDEQINTLKTCIEGDIGITETVEILKKFPSTTSSSVELQQRLCGLWTLLNDTAVGIPTAQPAIISILRHIRTLPREELPQDEDQEYFDFDDGYYWRELNYFASYKLEKHGLEEHMKRRENCISANAYTARLAATGDETLAMQGAALDRAASVAITDLQKKDDALDSGCVEAAAQLFVYAAREMFCLMQGDPEGEDVHSKRAYSGQCLIRRKEDHTPKESWDFLIERWSQIAEIGELPLETRAAARRALEAMGQVPVEGN